MTAPISKFISVIPLLLMTCTAFGQQMDMPMNKVPMQDLYMKTYDRDTSASAVVLNELGQAYIVFGDRPLMTFEHYQKIKVLKKRGSDQANFEILLRKQKDLQESILSIEAITYNLESGGKKTTRMDPKLVFKEDHKYYDLAKFTLPDIREGSVMEVLYRVSSPFFHLNFHEWEFQSTIPKIHTEYWAEIPGYYNYNISLRGFYKLSKEDSREISGCTEHANCILYKYAMDNVPAFVKEEYMTAESNFISAVHFELTEIRHTDGTSDKVTKTWKDADLELRQYPDFGQQIRKAENVMDDIVKQLTLGETDELQKATRVYNYLKDNYTWNGNRGYSTEFGVKKTFDTRKGNDADINLSLVGALQAAGLNSNPVILSTRDNGTPLEIFPVLSEFNYVIASVDIGGKRHLLDATNPLQPFGFLPLHCLNGKGRLMAKESSWIDLKPKDKKKTIRTINLAMNSDGSFKGDAAFQYHGYAAFSRRLEIYKAGGKDEFKKVLQAQMKETELLSYTLMNLDSIELPLIEKLEIKLDPAAGASTIYFNPFLFGKFDENPFKSSERLYPVDFGSPYEEVLTFVLKNLESFRIDEAPTAVALSLPNSGGKYLFNVSNLGEQVSVTSHLAINRAVYNSNEYHYLKELFARIVQINQSQIVLKKK